MLQKVRHFVIHNVLTCRNLDLGQLQNVVSVANQTMDGDLVKQLLQDLLKFGSVFAPLIYEVDPNESCEPLIFRCKAMWPLIDESPNLIKIAVCIYNCPYQLLLFFVRTLVAFDLGS